ncbi:unnamed protein product [Bursaphelenchus xylophilus]|uniref:(pine wood nematode) hypothetical protein n=1 Tax=Bursaphelenchus xylophilus TaxID=6326 RepID=A0A7I8WQR2_BURXY|nr:unnamed protein product [Bursaphelenchus xylophilus]CAG9097119.1 unnamed protein product [Bursaphelenchus xylophilus]
MLKRKRKDDPPIYHPPSVFPKFAHMDQPKKPRVNAGSSKKFDFAVTDESLKRDTLKMMLSVTRSDDLMVKQDRVKEIRNWLVAEPGKYTTIKVLCKELDIEVMEYEQNQSLVAFRDENGETQLGEANQLEAFDDFIVSASKRSLGYAKKKKVVLIREIPHVFLKNPHKLSELLLQMRFYCRSSIVFCLTQIDSCWELNHRRFFSSIPPQELYITHVKFNPIAKIEIGKAIKTMSEHLGLNVTTAFINAVKEKSNGDMNSAINMLEISRAQSARNMHSLLSSADLMAEFCHFIGKIIYAKRESLDNISLRQRIEVEKKVKEPFRRPIHPKDSVDELIAMCPTQSRSLVDYVSEYKLKFLNDANSLAHIYKDLCLANQIGCFYDTSNDNVLDKYAKELIVTSSFYHTNGKSLTKGIFAFSKPSGPNRDHLRGIMGDVNKLFPGGSYTQLLTSTLPMLTMMPSKASMNEISVIQSLKRKK